MSYEAGGIRSGAIRRSFERLGRIGKIQTYTPVVGGTGWALGTTGSVAQGRYAELGEDLVFFGAVLRFGTGATFGAGQPTVTLPPIRASASGSYATGIGNRSLVHVHIQDATGGAYSGVALLSATTISPLVFFVSGSFIAHNNVTSTQPHTWAAGDDLIVSGIYERQR